ncbi:MAG TPA: YqaJ viral recombinase family protein [Microbacteriaceae bacterium]|nr:YqaJ viral recombinase family protein [Microbacteriaceae bacterium]
MLAESLRRRVVADSGHRAAWLQARLRGVTATDAAHLATDRSVVQAAWHKLHPPTFTGNAYTEHGKAREPIVAEWARRRYGLNPSTLLFRSETSAEHLATPDGMILRPDGRLELEEIKTTTKPWRHIPRPYLRQVWWQQYVLGAERTLVVWEEHRDFVPVEPEPRCRWVDRDENEIEILVRRAERMLAIIHERTPAA